MKKDYSKKNFINSFGLCLPNFIPFLLFYIIPGFIFIIFDIKIPYFILIFLFSFIGLPLGGYLLNKFCTNKDIEKCKNCQCWNCKRK